MRKEFKIKLKKEKIQEYLENGILDIEAIMTQYTNYIYTIIKNKSSDFNQEDIEEIISDVFLTLWNNQEKLDNSKNLSSYIAGITKNLIKKKQRDRKVFENIEDYEEQMIISEKIDLYFEEQEQNEMIIQELDKFKTEEQTIFLMFYYQNKKIKEIANFLNISESKVKMKLSRTRKKLKRKLKERGI